MGFLILLRNLEEPEIWFPFIVLHLLGIAYFGFVHHFIFRRTRQSGGFAIFLTIVGTGMGQAYNRQVIKGLIAFILFVVLIIVGRTVDVENFVWVVLGYLVLVAVEANFGATKAEKKNIIRNRTKNLIAKSKVLLPYRNKGHQFAVDTNILMHDPDLLVYLLENENIDLYMSMMVFNELDGLKKNDSRLTRHQAQVAFDVIEEFQRRNKLHLLKTPKTDDIRKFGLGGSPDEKIIGTYLRENQNGRYSLMFLSNDKGARIIARNVGMPVVEF